MKRKERRAIMKDIRSIKEVKLLEKELLKMSHDCDILGEERSVFIGDEGLPLKRPREIGERLNEISDEVGVDIMQYVASRIVKEIEKKSWHYHADLRELDCCWDGIGDWQW